MIEIDPEITIGKDKALDKIDAEMIIVGMGICKISVEMMAEIEVGEISTEAIVVIGVGQEKEAYPPGGITIIIIIGKMEALYLDQDLRSRSNSRITRNRDRIRCYKCQEYDTSYK